MTDILDKEIVKELQTILTIIRAMKTLEKNGLDYSMDALDESYHAAGMILHEIKARQDLLKATSQVDFMDDEIKAQIYPKILRAKSLCKVGSTHEKEELVANLKAIFQEVLDIVSPPMPVMKCYIPIRESDFKPVRTYKKAEEQG